MQNNKKYWYPAVCGIFLSSLVSIKEQGGDKLFLKNPLLWLFNFKIVNFVYF